MVFLQYTCAASSTCKSSRLLNCIELKYGRVQRCTWQGVGVATQVDDWLGLAGQTEQLRGCPIKQLLDAPIECRLITDRSLVQGYGASLPGRL